MQTAEPLNDDWALVCSAASASRPADRLVDAMLIVASTCAKSIRRDPLEPLNAEERQVLDAENEGDPRFYDLMFRDDAISSTEYVLEWYDKTIALTQQFADAAGVETETLADGAIMCWDHIVPEYHNHQLCHMSALIAAQLVSEYPELHARTWLFSITRKDRWNLFLGLAQQLDVLDPTEIQELAAEITSRFT